MNCSTEATKTLMANLRSWDPSAKSQPFQKKTMNTCSMNTCLIKDLGDVMMIAPLRIAMATYVPWPEQFKSPIVFEDCAPDMFKYLKISGSPVRWTKVSTVGAPKGSKPRIWRRMLCIIITTDLCPKSLPMTVTFHPSQHRLKTSSRPNFQKFQCEETKIFYFKNIYQALVLNNADPKALNSFLFWTQKNDV